MNHSREISLNHRAIGPHRYREEISFDGGKQKMRRRVRRLQKSEWQTEVEYEEAQERQYWEDLLGDLYFN